MQQARARREFIKLISKIDIITAGKINACTELDVLRTKVTLFFADGVFNEALISEKVGEDVFLESQIKWVKDLFDGARSKRSM